MAQSPRQSVEVQDEAGKALEGAVVVIERGSAAYPEIARRTGKSGRLDYALPDGEFELAARTADGRIGRGRLTVKGGKSTALAIRVGRTP
jgi:hypothetical protein